jgi:hypothetical protein
MPVLVAHLEQLVAVALAAVAHALALLAVPAVHMVLQVALAQAQAARPVAQLLTL